MYVKYILVPTSMEVNIVSVTIQCKAYKIWGRYLKYILCVWTSTILDANKLEDTVLPIKIMDSQLQIQSESEL